MKHIEAKKMIRDARKRYNDSAVALRKTIRLAQQRCKHKWEQTVGWGPEVSPEWTCVGCGRVVNQEPKQGAKQ